MRALRQTLSLGGSRSPRKSRTSKRVVRKRTLWGGESLEPRRPLASDLVGPAVQGTEANDVIIVRVEPGLTPRVRVQVNDRAPEYFDYTPRGPLLVVDAGDGDDKVIVLGDQPVEIRGGAGDDQLMGGAGADLLIGGEGDDLMHGGGGNDVLAGDGPMAGTSGNDILRGGDGDDWVYGDGGDDQLFGDAGDDLLAGGDGADMLLGGDGDDVLIAAWDDNACNRRGWSLLDNDWWVAMNLMLCGPRDSDGRPDTLMGGPGWDRGRIDATEGDSAVDVEQVDTPRGALSRFVYADDSDYAPDLSPAVVPWLGAPLDDEPNLDSSSSAVEPQRIDAYHAPAANPLLGLDV